jgi:hypothetical protein
MDNALCKAIMERFDNTAFDSFFQKLINDPSYGRHVERVGNIDNRIFDCLPERFNYNMDAFFLCYEPYSIFKAFDKSKIDFDNLRKLISKYITNRNYAGPWSVQYGITLYIINNFDSNKMRVSDVELMELHEHELSQVLPSDFYSIGVGNLNTFATASPDNPDRLYNLLCDFISNHDTGLCIGISDKDVSISRFIAESEFPGITQESKTLLQPVYKRITVANKILEEFNRLIFSDARESQLEEFLHTYYQQIFGNEYDQISTQVWLKFPDLDIGQRERRLDIMMRNTIKDDWELFELKCANVELTKTISDVPMFVSAVNDAIAQAKNYKRLLEQDKVKRALAADGIEYYEPEVNLVIGKKPAISNSQWRRLLADNQNGLRLITYDNLLKEAQNRYSELTKLLE